MRAISSSPMARTSCKVEVELIRTPATQPAQTSRDRWQELPGNESVAHIYSSASRNDLIDGWLAAGGTGRIQAIAGLCLAGSGLPDNSGSHVLSGSRFRSDGFLRHSSARTTIRTSSRTEPDDFD